MEWRVEIMQCKIKLEWRKLTCQFPPDGRPTLWTFHRGNSIYEDLTKANVSAFWPVTPTANVVKVKLGKQDIRIALLGDTHSYGAQSGTC